MTRKRPHDYLLPKIKLKDLRKVLLTDVFLINGAVLCKIQVQVLYFAKKKLHMS